MDKDEGRVLPTVDGLSRRDVLRGAFGTGVLASLAGCRSSTGPPESTDERAETTDDVTVELWHQETQLDRQEKMLALANRFERRHGTHVDIEAIDSQELHVEFQLRDADEAFTLAQFNTSQLDFVRGTDHPAVGVARETVDRIGRERFWDNVLQQAAVDGGYLGVPFFVWVQGPWYRQSVFDDYGISSKPRSWDQLLDVARELHEPADDQYGIVIGTDPATEYPTHCYTQIALANDVPLFGEDGEILFDTDAHVETLEYYKQLAEYTPPGVVKPVPAFEAFVNERAHFGIYPTHLITYVWNRSDDPQNAVADLRFVGYMEETRRSAYGLMNYLVFNAHASETQLDAAREFVEFLLVDDDHANYQDWLSVQIGGFQPVFEDFHERESYHTNEILQHVDRSIHHELIPEGIAAIERFGGIVHGEYFPVVGKIEGKFLISKAIRRVLDGESAQTVAEETADKMREMRE